MTNYVLPTCYVAGTVLLIGEKYRDLINLRNKLLPQFFYHLFDEPTQAMQFLQSSYVPYVGQQTWLEKNVVNNKAEQTDGLATSLLTELASSHRFEEIPVIVIDTMIMPDSAIEFCQQIGQTTYKKLLLITPNELSDAKQALSNGVIDGYVIKDASPTTYIKLTTAITTLAYNYFQQSSLPIVRRLQTQLPYLSDIAFVDFFQTLCFDKNIVEFYLTDQQGSYLLLDAQARPFYLKIAIDQIPPAWSNEQVNVIYSKHTYYYHFYDTAHASFAVDVQEWVSFLAFCTRATEYL